MKIFQEFQKSLNEHEVNEYISRINSHLPSDWKYDEERGRQMLIGDIRSFMYIYSGNRFPKCILCFSYYDNRLKVSNIVPMEISQISMEQYNDILTEFVTKIIPEEMATLTSDELDPEKIMSADMLTTLHAFCSGANKSTGSGHPCDRKRWNQFIISAFRNGGEDKLHEDLLKRILVEKYHWNEEMAGELIHEYTSGLSLLDTYRASEL